MNGASKILTVSYGTFSCTLEGFEDPFNTMRAIAEYFRDLAAEDRYFGAEPPTPDAAMLHKIAEREIQRRVDAKIQDNGVILRAADAGAPAQPQRTPLAGPAFVAPQLDEPGLAAAQPDAAASILTRMALLRNAQAASAAHAVIPQDDGYAEDQDAALLPDHLSAALAAQGTAAPVAPTDRPQPLADAGMEPVADSMIESAEETAEETIASVMAGLPEPEPEPDAAPSPAPVKGNEALFALADTLPEDEPQDAPEEILAPPPADMSSESVADPNARTAADPAPTDDAILAAALGTLIDPENDMDPADAMVARPLAPYAAPTIEPVTPPAEAVLDLPSAIVTEDIIDMAEIDMAEISVADDAAQNRQHRAHARVIKIRRITTDIAAAQDQTPASDAAPQAAEAEPVPAQDASETPAFALSPEAEAELQRELAALEAETAPPLAAAAPEPAPEPEPEPETAPEPVADALPEPARRPDEPQSEDAVNRLIDQTNSVMAGPENKRRLAAIAHLKAAVAATFADRQANPGATSPGPQERRDAYREDLDRVVRPRRPALVGSAGHETGTTPTARPQIDKRPAPLVLVSEQRIDRPASLSAAAAAAAIAPVRPRRVVPPLLPSDAAGPHSATDAAADDIDTEGFMSRDEVSNIFNDPSQPFDVFAERLGASSMAEMLEAAAAYCALHLGRDQFTRPLLLQQIAALPQGADITREDCLRGFGTLLRDGRIEKIKRGQFKLADHSRYLAEARRHAG